MAVHVINEARRCLQCKKPLCRLQGCPAQTNIPEMIRLFLAGKPREAGAMLFQNNPMSVVCSLVCDHEAQCEGHCIQGRKGSPVQISSIEHYISDAYLDWAVRERQPEKHQHVAVIGAGNSAMDVARTAVRMGSRHVTIYCRGQKARASQREIDYTIADGVAELTEKGPMLYQRTFEEGEVVAEGEPQLYEADTTIIAASQTTKSKIADSTTGLELGEHGLIAVHGNGETTKEGVFSGGDVVLGPWNVIQTVKNSKAVAEAMDAYLTRKREAQVEQGRQ